MSELRLIKELQADIHALAENGEKTLPMPLAMELVDRVRDCCFRLSNLEKRLGRFVEIDESFNPNAADDAEFLEE